VKRRDFERLLSKHGCSKVRDQGKHDVWKNAHGDVSSVPRHAEIKKHTARGICKQLKIDPKEVPN
jgi:predicted RNA binding protein YcfA (HicA-like mRNA interferase family)